MTPPLNDNFADATLMVVDLTYHDTLLDSTSQAHDFYAISGGDESTAAYYASVYPHTVWYRFVPAEDDTATFDMETLGDAIAVLYQVTDPATLENLSFVAPFTGVFEHAVLAGQVFYVQVVEQDVDYDLDFDLSVALGHPPPDLDAAVTAPATLTAGIGLAMAFSATVHGSATVSGLPIWNGYFGVLVAQAAVRGSLHVDDNPRVTTWVGDPPPTGDFPAPDTAPQLAGITIEEFTGPDGNQQPVEEWINLLAADDYSAGEFGYRDHPLGPAASGLVYGVERWLQVRVQAPFDTLASLRFWAEGLELAPGWSINYGVSTIYSAPRAGASAVATVPLPTADPGLDAPNLIEAPMIGTADCYSKWLVLQAVCDPTLGNRQPIGYASESWRPVPFEIRFAWLEVS